MAPDLCDAILFQLLSYVLEDRGRLVSREELCVLVCFLVPKAHRLYLFRLTALMDLHIIFSSLLPPQRLCFLLFLLLLFNLPMSGGELSFDFLLRGHCSTEPVMSQQISHVQSLAGLVLHHLIYQVDEVLCEATLLEFRVHFPESFGLILVERTVVGVIRLGHLEGRVSSVQDEQDYAQSKQVGLLTRVWLACVQLRAHVAFSAQLCLEQSLPVAASNGGSEPKIGDLYIIIFVD